MLNKKMILLIPVATLVFVGCGKEEKTSSVRNKIIVAQGGEPKTLDPHEANETISSRINTQIYDKLVYKDSNEQIVPQLAEKWEKLDENTTLFTLKENIKFHNGEVLKASDVKFTLDRMKNSPKVGHIIKAIEKVEVIGENQFTIVTDGPFGGLLDHLAHSTAVIVNEKAVKEGGKEYGQNPVGTGPYIYDSWSAGDRVILKRNPEYFKGIAQVEEIIFRNISEGSNRTIGLETGEVDIAFDIDTIDIDRVNTHEKLAYKSSPSLTINYLGFNLNKPNLSNVLVRKAISYAIDSESIISVVYAGQAIPANSPIGPDVFGYSSQLQKPEYNPEKSKNLLTQAGLEKGFKTKIWVDENTARKDTATIIQAQLKDVGIDATVEILERGTFLDNSGKGMHDIIVSGWTHSTGYPDVGMTSLFHSQTSGGAGNRSFYKNLEVDSSLENARVALNNDDRQKYYEKAQEIIQDELPILTLSYPSQNAGFQKDISGFSLSANGAPSFYNLKIETN